MKKIGLVIMITGLIFVLAEIALKEANAFWNDCDQSLYMANEGNGGGGTSVVRVDCTGNITFYAVGFVGTSGLVVEKLSGDLIISDDSPGIFKVDTSGNIIRIAESVVLDNPNGLALDALGRLIVADAGSRILRITLNPDGSANNVEVLAEGFWAPQGVVETEAGDVLFGDIEGYIYRITPETNIPISYPAEGQRLPVGNIVPGNEGSITLDAEGNIYTGNFGNRIVRITPDGQTAKDVVNIPPSDCPPGQVGLVLPSLRGLVFDPDGNLVATGYCLDNVYIFNKADIDNAWITNTPVSVLPAPFAENPSGALDGPFINGPFGVAFWFSNTVSPNTINIPVDIKPTSCPNPINVKSKGELPVAVLGTQDFDVTYIDTASIRLEGVAPIISNLEDVSTPFEPLIGKEYIYDCNDYGSDGYGDLTLKFRTQNIVSAVGDVNDGGALILKLTGNLKEEYGGTPIQGEDVVVIKK